MSARFLYIEDDPLSQDIMRTILQLNGYEELTIYENTTAFASRVQALRPTPDIIFLDIHIQPIDGFEILKILRQMPGYDSIPVIAVTASVMNDEIERLQEAGFDGAVAKPLDYDVFPTLLQDILDGASVWYIG